MFILSGVSKARLDGDIATAWEKQGRSFPSVLCCYSILEVSSATRHGQVMYPVCFLIPSRLAPMRTLDPEERGKIVRNSKKSPNNLLFWTCSWKDSSGCSFGTWAGTACPAAGLCFTVVSHQPFAHCLGAGGLGSPHCACAGGNSQCLRGRVTESAPPQGNSPRSSAFAMQNLKANVHQVKVGPTTCYT